MQAILTKGCSDPDSDKASSDDYHLEIRGHFLTQGLSVHQRAQVIDTIQFSPQGRQPPH
jgi:hypothetical protein